MPHALFTENPVTVPIGIFLLSIILYAIKELVKYAQVLRSKRAQQTNLAISKDTPSITSLTEGGKNPHVIFDQLDQCLQQQQQRKQRALEGTLSPSQEPTDPSIATQAST